MAPFRHVPGVDPGRLFLDAVARVDTDECRVAPSGLEAGREAEVRGEGHATAREGHALHAGVVLAVLAVLGVHGVAVGRVAREGFFGPVHDCESVARTADGECLTVLDT